MPSRFQNEFPADNWRLKIRHDLSDEDYRLYSEDDDGYRDFAIIDDDDDSAWMKFDTRRDYDMRYVYLQVEEEVIRLAISPSGNEPTKVSYSYDVENIFFAFQWTVFCCLADMRVCRYQMGLRYKSTRICLRRHDFRRNCNFADSGTFARYAG